MVEGVEMTDSEFYERVCGLARLMMRDVVPGGLVNAWWEMNVFDYVRFYCELVARTESGEPMNTLYGIGLEHSLDFPEGEIRLVMGEVI